MVVHILLLLGLLSLSGALVFVGITLMEVSRVRRETIAIKRREMQKIVRDEIEQGIARAASKR